MKPVCFAAAIVVLFAGCTSTSPPANGVANNASYVLPAPNGAPPQDAAARPPRLTVGTSYPDTQLILPWFLNDVINFVNYR